jgi:EamA domain-containing membrane protein RarD
MKSGLILVGVVFLLVALAFLVLGQVWVAQGKKGTWGIWPLYIIHGVAGLIALACFFAAAPRKPKEQEGPERGGNQ